MAPHPRAHGKGTSNMVTSEGDPRLAHRPRRFGRTGFDSHRASYPSYPSKGERCDCTILTVGSRSTPLTQTRVCRLYAISRLLHAFQCSSFCFRCINLHQPDVDAFCRTPALLFLVFFHQKAEARTTKTDEGDRNSEFNTADPPAWTPVSWVVKRNRHGARRLQGPLYLPRLHRRVLGAVRFLPK